MRNKFKIVIEALEEMRAMIDQTPTSDLLFLEKEMTKQTGVIDSILVKIETKLTKRGVPSHERYEDLNNDAAAVAYEAAISARDASKRKRRLHE